jgi:hypothetical protein
MQRNGGLDLMVAVMVMTSSLVAVGTRAVGASTAQAHPALSEFSWPTSAPAEHDVEHLASVPDTQSPTLAKQARLRRLGSDCAALTRADIAALAGPGMTIVRNPADTNSTNKRAIGARRYCSWHVEGTGDLASAELWYQLVPGPGRASDNSALPGWTVESINTRGFNGVSKCVVDDYLSLCVTDFTVKEGLLSIEVSKDRGPPNQEALRAFAMTLTDRVLANLSA